jgi:adenosylcobinamide kinase / adenosylcobinamide-phosphate guanylyltransferase
MGLTVLLGGARSGKSSLAVELGRRQRGAVTYIATGVATDDEMSARIDRHRDERPSGWLTIESPTDLVGAMSAADGSFVIVDCLTLWTSNLMWDGCSDADIAARALAAARFAAEHDVVAVSNEVGSGIHPDTELGRRYRDTLGRVNQTWVEASSQALLVVAGRALELRDPWDVLA